MALSLPVNLYKCPTVKYYINVDHSYLILEYPIKIIQSHIIIILKTQREVG